MFWDNVAGIYALFENLYNGKVNRELVKVVSCMVDKDDRVLECACGTGMLSVGIGARCRELIATDYSIGMLRKAKENCRHLENIKVFKANIMHIRCKDGAFDKVVAGNVIHLLDYPEDALKELLRCCKKGGKVIVPTYVNKEKSGKVSMFIRLLEKYGANFKKQFDYKSYQTFFKNVGYEDVEFCIVDGKMPCAIAVITK